MELFLVFSDVIDHSRKHRNSTDDKYPCSVDILSHYIHESHYQKCYRIEHSRAVAHNKELTRHQKYHYGGNFDLDIENNTYTGEQYTGKPV